MRKLAHQNYQKASKTSKADKKDAFAQQDSGDLMQFFQYEKAPAALVHHYIPSNLPMMPIFIPSYVADCVKSWKHIITGDSDRLKEFAKPGIVLFYDEFLTHPDLSTLSLSCFILALAAIPFSHPNKLLNAPFIVTLIQ